MADPERENMADPERENKVEKLTAEIKQMASRVNAQFVVDKEKTAVFVKATEGSKQKKAQGS